VIGRNPDGEETARRLWWGFTPHWMQGKGRREMINARSETVKESPMFRAAFHRHRCLVPADGFYEWAPTASGKQPWYIRPVDGGLFFFAGIFTRLPTDHVGGEFGFALLTTEAGDDVRPIHSRQPVMLTDDQGDAWLAPDSEPGLLASLCRPSAPRMLESWPVSTRVNRPANDDADLLQAVDRQER
jgi:putative SOS response-associated peptidase YedK